MTQRTYTEDKSTNAKITRVIVIVLPGSVILLIGVWLVNTGLTAESCSGGIFGFFQTCQRTVDYSSVGLGTVFLVTNLGDDLTLSSMRVLISESSRPFMR